MTRIQSGNAISEIKQLMVLVSVLIYIGKYLFIGHKIPPERNKEQIADYPQNHVVDYTLIYVHLLYSLCTLTELTRIFLDIMIRI